MKLVYRVLAPRDTDYELLFGVLLIPSTLAVARFVTRLPSALLPRCLLHDVANIPCISCGASRSLHLLARGRLLEAWLMQPLLISLVALALLYACYSFVVVFGRKPRLRLADVSPAEQRALWLTAGALVLVNWVYIFVTGV